MLDSLIGLSKVRMKEEVQPKPVKTGGGGAAQPREAETLEQLAMELVHDFKNILANIRGQAELLLLRISGESHPMREGLEKILKSVEMANTVIQQTNLASRLASQAEEIESGARATQEMQLPGSEGEPTRRIPGERVAQQLSTAQTILLVEDNTDLLNSVRSVLEAFGYTILTAKDGVEALAVSERHSGTIDLLLTDLIMPRLGGRALSRYLSSLRSTIRVLYMSGSAQPEDLEAGAAFLGKPFSEEALVSKVRELIDKLPERTRTDEICHSFQNGKSG